MVRVTAEVIARHVESEAIPSPPIDVFAQPVSHQKDLEEPLLSPVDLEKILIELHVAMRHQAHCRDIYWMLSVLKEVAKHSWVLTRLILCLEKAGDLLCFRLAPAYEALRKVRYLPP